MNKLFNATKNQINIITNEIKFVDTLINDIEKRNFDYDDVLSLLELKRDDLVSHKKCVRNTLIKTVDSQLNYKHLKVN